MYFHHFFALNVLIVCLLVSKHLQYNNFAGFSPRPKFICPGKRTLPNSPSLKTNKVQCIIIHVVVSFIISLAFYTD